MIDRQDTSLLYGVEDKPGFGALLLYGMQWWLVAMPNIIVMGLVVAKLHHDGDLAAQIAYMQKLFGLVAVAIAAQTFFGHRLPAVPGPAAVLLIGAVSAASASAGAVYGGIFVGGLVVTAAGASGLLQYTRAVFTPRVIIEVMLLIPLTVIPTIVRLVFQDPGNEIFDLLYAIALLFVLFAVNKSLRGVWKSTTLLWGLVLGSLGVFLVKGFPAAESVFPASGVSEAAFFPPMAFDPGVILSFFLCAVVLIINEIGSVQAVGRMVGADDMDRRCRRAVVVTGAANLAAGALGVMGTVDYSTSPGIIAATRCGSRFPFIPAAILLGACSVLPDLLALFLAQPSLVMGTVLLYIMSTQLAAGFMLTVRERAVLGFSDGMTVAIPLMVGLIASAIPASVLVQLPSSLRPVIGNGFVMGMFAIMVLEHGFKRFGD